MAWPSSFSFQVRAKLRLDSNNGRAALACQRLPESHGRRRAKSRGPVSSGLALTAHGAFSHCSVTELDGGGSWHWTPSRKP